MKTVIILLSSAIIISIIVIGILMGASLLTDSGSGEADHVNNEAEVSDENQIPAANNQPEPEEAVKNKDESGTVQNQSDIEIYLDGYKDSGIFLGNAATGLESPEAASIYGSEFINSGFSFNYNIEELNFEPNSIHYIYVYKETEEFGWVYKKQKFQIPGEPQTDNNIRVQVDKPSGDFVKGDTIEFIGWAADTSSPNDPAIEKIEIYLNGPKGFGKFVGEVNYGLPRGDVAEFFGNPNYVNCGFSYELDISNLKPGTSHNFYIYAYKGQNNYQITHKDITIEGAAEENDLIFSINPKYLQDKNQLNINGWIAQVDFEVQKIIFVSNIYGNEDIFSMNLDGSGLKQLTTSEGDDWYPAVSIDGKKIAYTTEKDDYWQIMTMDLDGSNKKQVTSTPEKNGDPTFSFDMKYIFFEKYIDGDWEIFRMDRDGSNVVQLTDNPERYDWHPFAHTRENKLLFESGIDEDYDIYIMDSNGQNMKKLTNQDYVKRVPSISLDGQKIIFFGFKNKNYDIFLMDNKGENITNITNSSMDEVHPSISPDNKYIIYQGSVEEKLQIFISEIDGSNRKILTSGENYARMPAFAYQISK